MIIDTSQAVQYHLGKFPPAGLDYQRLMPGLLGATAALARYDQMLRSLHNSELFLAPLRGQEAVVSSRMEGTISTLDEILQVEAEYGEDDAGAALDYRSDAIETVLYRRALNAAQQKTDVVACHSAVEKLLEHLNAGYNRIPCVLDTDDLDRFVDVDLSTLDSARCHCSTTLDRKDVFHRHQERFVSLAGRCRDEIIYRLHQLVDLCFPRGVAFECLKC